MRNHQALCVEVPDEPQEESPGGCRLSSMGSTKYFLEEMGGTKYFLKEMYDQWALFRAKIESKRDLLTKIYKISQFLWRIL
jgi:hypothetical protein